VGIHYEEALYQVYAPLPLPSRRWAICFTRSGKPDREFRYGAALGKYNRLKYVVDVYALQILSVRIAAESASINNFNMMLTFDPSSRN